MSKRKSIACSYFVHFCNFNTYHNQGTYMIDQVESEYV